MQEYSFIIKIIFLMWYLLIGIAVIFFLSGIDEVFFDIFFWSRYLYRKFKLKKYTPLNYKDLVAVPERKIAIIIPCWHEHNVIAAMLSHNVANIDYDNYDFFVGVYPNDPATITAVQTISDNITKVHEVIGDKPGPTNKADNLNSVYNFIREYEKKYNIQYEIIVFHDSEDLIHPLSLKLFNYLIPRKDMIQLPVFPLEVSLKNFTHWIYNDEFAEIHTKNNLVRELIKGLVPSAGVATAFSRASIDALAKENRGLPFSTKSLVEDYDISLRLHLAGFKQIFLLKTVKRTVNKKRWGLFGKIVPKKVNEYIAARALFPTEYRKSIRQKARWIMGISLQEWKNHGWPGNFATRYTLLHDRKALITHVINIFAYFVFIFWIFYMFWQRYHPEYPSLQDFLNDNHLVWYLIVICTLIMIERMIQRTIAIYRIYGFFPALLTIPRVIFGNIINMHALLRAYYQYFIVPLISNRQQKWDKTEHIFPTQNELKTYRKKLGNLLLENNFITKEQLTEALSNQMISGDRLGAILLKEKYLNERQLLEILAKQYHLPITDMTIQPILMHQSISKISKYNYSWLIKNNILPIKVYKNILYLAISGDPSSVLNNAELLKNIRPYEAKFVLAWSPFEKAKQEQSDITQAIQQQPLPKT